METHVMSDGRRKLTDSDRLEIHRRYYGRLKTKETVTGIAECFNISRLWVRQTAEAVEAAKTKARSSDQDAGR